MKNLDLKSDSTNKADIETKTTSSMELVLDSFIENFATLG
jgi:hypothetical protein